MCGAAAAAEGAGSGDGYEAVSLAARETVSGKNLVIAAYTVIFVFLSLYVLSIWIRERNVRKALLRLMKSIESGK
jgi:hypothetical protein